MLPCIGETKFSILYRTDAKSLNADPLFGESSREVTLNVLACIDV